MSATGLHISISAEPIFYIGDLAVTNSMLTSVIVTSLLVAFALLVNRSIKNSDKPQPLQNFAEWIVESMYGFINGITNDGHKSRLFLPLIASFFLFIIINNWFGLLPGVGTIMVPVAHHEEEVITHEQEDTLVAEHGENLEIHESEAEIITQEAENHVVETSLFRPATADLNTTLALGAISIIATQLFGFHFLKLGYLTKFFNFSSPIMFFVGILELISEFAKVVSFAFRLFGNVFAGEVLLVVITYLTRVIVPVPFYGLEVFVGFIQALVFALLSVVFFNMATQGHEEH